MSRQRRKHDRPRVDSNSQKRSALVVTAVATFAALALLAFFVLRSGEKRQTYQQRPKGTLTYNKDIAPIFYEYCLNCHRPGESAHLDLVTYADAKKNAKLIAKVVGNRYMPPWLPEEGFGEFLDERRLTVDQIGMIQQWVSEGTSEGNASDLPPKPKWTEGWQLGQPDLVVTMAEPYQLEPSGKDVYRNFVIPISIGDIRFVQAVEFRPGNSKVVHHAAMRLDTTPLSRKYDEQDPGPGFAGMNMPESTRVPNGQFLNWQPGKLPYRSPEEFSWVLEKNTDLVVQMHMRPGEKAESVQCSVGFFFNDKPPTKQPFKIILDTPTIDIPAGVKDYTTTDSFVLPVDVDIHAVFPHAHYLGKELQGFATLPDGTKKWLLRIKQWDFDWQGDYRFKQPIFVPKGSTVTMQFSYDNSSDNVRNPNQPPKRVLFGTQTTDEMGELWLQAVPRSKADFTALAQAYSVNDLNKAVGTSDYKLRLNPENATAHLHKGKALMALQRISEAMPHFQKAAQLDPGNDQPHYSMGVAFRLQRDLVRAKRELQTALQLNPENYKTHGNIAYIYLDEGDLSRAEQHFQRALRINPEDTVAVQGLQQVANAQKRVR